MRRWSWLGLLGLMACFDEEPPAPPTPGGVPGPPQVCPFLGQGAPLPQRASPWASVRDAPPREGAEPVLIRYRSGHPVRVEHLRYDWPRLQALAARLTPEEVRSLAKDPRVLAIAPDGPVFVLGEPSREGRPREGSTPSGGEAGELTESLRMIQAPEVWDANGDGVLDAGAPTGEGIQVCVIDSGWDDRHPELRAAYAGGWDFLEADDDPRDYSHAERRWGGGHGTHVAGTLAARLGSGGRVRLGSATGGMVGVAPGASLLIARVLDLQGRGRISDVIAALEWCRSRGAHIATLSLASPQPHELLRQTLEEALAAGMLSVAASGNSGTEDPQTGPPIAHPAAYPSVLAVGAVDLQGQHPLFSQAGPELGLVAPGVDVLSTSILGAADCSAVEAGGRILSTQVVEYSARGDYTGPLVVCDLGEGERPCDGAVARDGFVALVAPGGLPLAEKVSRVVEQGARAVLLPNDDPRLGEGFFSFGAPGAWPLALSVSHAAGLELRALAGTRVRVSFTGVDYVRLSGTSTAVPYVSGTAALVWSARPELTAAQVRELLRRSARDLGPPGRDVTFGWGLVQARDALGLLADLPP